MKHGDKMEFQVGDPVVHCSYGMGKVTGVEERAYNESTTTYYKIEVMDLTIWVPADENLKSRLRLPASVSGFKKMLGVLSATADTLPKDRRERNTLLQDRMKDGSVESLCKVLRDLSFFRRDKSWSEYDSALMKRAQKALLGEWVYILSVTPDQAEAELQRLLAR
jgi:RNA polymerase-interacting CarD/CdnL/TRCF family regulator